MLAHFDGTTVLQLMTKLKGREFSFISLQKRRRCHGEGSGRGIEQRAWRKQPEASIGRACGALRGPFHLLSSPLIRKCSSS